MACAARRRLIPAPRRPHSSGVVILPNGSPTLTDTSIPPGTRAWRYDGAETVADAVVHGLGIVLALAGTAALLAAGFGSKAPLPSRAVYCASLLISFTASALYNLWPVSPLKWRLRRIDHAMIFGLIAGTYTPFLASIGTTETTVLLGAIWAVSLLGIALKLVAVGRREWISTILYIALGWSGILAGKTLLGQLSTPSLVLIGIGGLLYSFGTLFHHWRALRFQNVIWHTFVLAAAACHFVAVTLAGEAAG